MNTTTPPQKERERMKKTLTQNEAVALANGEQFRMIPNWLGGCGNVTDLVKLDEHGNPDYDSIIFRQYPSAHGDFTRLGAN